MNNEPFIKIDGKVYNEEIVSKMSSFEITELINKIPAQIQKQKAYIAKLKKSKDSESRKKLGTALRIKEQYQLAYNWISVIRKKKNIQYNTSVDGNFREAAHQVLDEQTFQSVLLRAKAITEMESY